MALQTLIREALTYFCKSSIVNSIALLELPQAEKTVSNRLSDSSK